MVGRKKGKMKRNTMLTILNPILGVLLLSQVVTGISHKALPHEAFEILHQGGGLLLAVAALLHVTLNWNWVKANFFKRRPHPGPGNGG